MRRRLASSEAKRRRMGVASDVATDSGRLTRYSAAVSDDCPRQRRSAAHVSPAFGYLHFFEQLGAAL
ncbi:hypothetical protein LSAT2_027646 [Lamellibrachia satsuma]|nr:hypothetical protein LSAT2_027646 [Lamellibrachia satsuma]